MFYTNRRGLTIRDSSNIVLLSIVFGIEDIFHVFEMYSMNDRNHIAIMLLGLESSYILDILKCVQ
jgi:hypothetical protein